MVKSDPNNTLDGLAEYCRRGMVQMTPEFLEEMRRKIKELLDKIAHPSFKHIGGEDTCIWYW